MDAIFTGYFHLQQKSRDQQLSDLVLFPLRTFCGRHVAVTTRNEQRLLPSVNLITRIVFGIIALLILPLTIYGACLALRVNHLPIFFDKRWLQRPAGIGG